MYKNLREELERGGVEAGAIAACIGLPPESFFRKIQGQEAFTIEEAFQIKRLFFPRLGLQYLFQR